MSWAALRTTTRIEDEAYCLLGIFDINMPLLYGEGARAFRRLQLEIIKESSDESIFAWGLDVGHSDPIMKPFSVSGIYSVLAASPRDFANCKNLRQLRYRRISVRTFSVTNLGLKIRVPVQARKSSTASCGQSLDLELNCFTCDQKEHLLFPVVLHLHQDEPQFCNDQNMVWHRFECHLSTGLTLESYTRTAEYAQINDTKSYLNIKS